MTLRCKNCRHYVLEILRDGGYLDLDKGVYHSNYGMCGCLVGVKCGCGCSKPEYNKEVEKE